MNDFTLTKTRFRDGLWEGLLVAETQTDNPPDILASCETRPVPGVTINETSEAGRWVVEVPVPVEVLGDGVRTVTILNGRDDSVLQSFSVIAGEALSDDIRAEIDLLRSELDLLKRAFRQHCRDSG